MASDAWSSRLLPEPRNLWIRHHPRRWPSTDGWWLDLGTSELARDVWTEAADLPVLDDAAIAELDDVVYLPPVPSGLDAERRRLAQRLQGAGAPLLLQARSGAVADWEVDAADERDRTLLVVDTCEALVDAAEAGFEGALAELPVAAVVVVPLLPGWLDGSGFERLVSALAAAPPRAVHLVAPRASPLARRELAARLDEENGYRQLFHAPAPDEGEWQRCMEERGLRTAVSRPLPAGPPRLRSNRRLSGLLLLAGELSARTDRSGRAAAPLFRAARWIDRTDYDFEALAREDNLRVIEWLEPPARELLEEALEVGPERLLDELLARSRA